ncbi:MAG: FecR family protein [Pseudomonadota bacterium]
MSAKISAIAGALFGAAIFAASFMSGAAAQDNVWRVSKASGDISIEAPGAQPVALTATVTINPGDTIRTGANGRVLLERGAETMMISPNSVVGIPKPKDGSAITTTILQQSGSILLNVEKKNVQHFEVSTPYLAAVVKGTEFRVTVGEKTSRVEVLRGQVQVTDYKSGQRALVNPEQAAAVTWQGAPGLSLSGSGRLNLIEFGPPQTPPAMPSSVPAMRTASATQPGAASGAGASAGAPAAASGAAPAKAPASTAASAPALSPALPRRMESTDANKNTGWAEALSAWINNLFKSGGRKNNGELDMTFVAIPMAVGLSVAAGAMVMRRRRKSPEKDKK